MSSHQDEEHREDHSHADQLDGEKNERREQNHAVFPHNSDKLIMCLTAMLKFVPDLLVAPVVIRFPVVPAIVIVVFISL